MILVALWLFAFVMILTGLFGWIFDDDGPGELILGVLLGIFGLIIFFVWGQTPAKFVESKKTIEIVALKDNFLVNGKLFLGSGSIEEELTLVYAKKTEKGFKLKQIRADEVDDVIEDDFVVPSIQIADGDYESYWWLTPQPALNGFSYHTVRIYLPKGSVDLSFKIDLEE